MTNDFRRKLDAALDLVAVRLDATDAASAIEALDQVAAAAPSEAERKALKEAVGSMALGYLRAGDPSKALVLYKFELAMAQQGEDEVTVALSLGNVGQALGMLGEYEQAFSIFRELLRYFTVLEMLDNAKYAAENMHKAMKCLGRNFLHHVSSSVADCFRRSLTGTLPVDDLADRQDLRLRLVQALLALSDDHEAIAGLVASATIDELMKGPEEALCKTIGQVARATTDPTAPDPIGLHNAARYLVQVRRVARARDVLGKARREEFEPDYLTGTGSGGFILYLRSFAAEHEMPALRLDPWGRINLEDALASGLEEAGWPLIALGDADLPAFGAGRAQTDDPTWQEDLVRLGTHSDLVLVTPTATRGTSWEMEWIVINKLLRKTIFVMPPAPSEARPWWEEQWQQLQRWSRYLGLWFPDYDPDGVFFSSSLLAEGAQRGYAHVMSQANTWLAVFDVLTELVTSDEWVDDSFKASLNSLLTRKEADDLGIDQKELLYRRADEHIDRVARRTRQLMPDDPDFAESFAPRLAMLEGGPFNRGSFANWPPPPATASMLTRSGVYTIWGGPRNLLAVASVSDLMASLDDIAEGRETVGFTKDFLNNRILPSVNSEVRSDLEHGLLPAEKAVRFRVRRDLSYRFLPASAQEGDAMRALIIGGALDVGIPELAHITP